MVWLVFCGSPNAVAANASRTMKLSIRIYHTAIMLTVLRTFHSGKLSKNSLANRTSKPKGIITEYLYTLSTA